MPVTAFDHVAIPTANPEALIAFYRALGFSTPDFDEWKRSGLPFFAITFGQQKINVHAPEFWQREDFTLRGPTARPGCGDLCFVWSGGLDALGRMLTEANVEIEAGPVSLTGGRGTGTSVYVRDPDGNLVEFISYEE